MGRSFLPPSARPAFFDAYAPVGDETVLRARVLALFLSAALAEYAAAEGNRDLLRESVAGLGRALAR